MHYRLSDVAAVAGLAHGSARVMRHRGQLGIARYAHRLSLTDACVVVLTQGFNFAAEIAFSVEAAYQNRGIGTMLVKKSISIARNRYVGTAYLFCLRENGKMRHIAGKFEAEFSYIGADIEGKVSPHWPSYLSYFEEAEMDGHTIWQAAFPTEQ